MSEIEIGFLVLGFGIVFTALWHIMSFPSAVGLTLFIAFILWGVSGQIPDNLNSGSITIEQQQEMKEVSEEMLDESQMELPMEQCVQIVVDSEEITPASSISEIKEAVKTRFALTEEGLTALETLEFGKPQTNEQTQIPNTKGLNLRITLGT